MTFREPLGVVALITPWNFPLIDRRRGSSRRRSRPGNTVVLEAGRADAADRAASSSGSRVEAGLPEGVVNVVAGPGRTCGQRLVEHPDVAKVAFTGSTEVGRAIAAGAAQTIKRVTLELGGKSANVVFADADIQAAAAAAPGAVFGNAGQDCCARSRILVERSALDEFMEAFEEAVEAITVGDPLDEATEMGPLISAGQRETVASFVPDGAPVAIRGSRPRRPGLLVPADRAVPGRSRRPRGARGDLRAGRGAWSRSATRRRRWRSPTTRSTGSRARCGRATAPRRCGSRARSRPA